MELHGLVCKHYNNQQCLEYYLRGMSLHRDDYHNIDNHVNLLPIEQRYDFEKLRDMCQNLVEARLLREAHKIEEGNSKSCSKGVANVASVSAASLEDNPMTEVLQQLKTLMPRMERLEKGIAKERCTFCHGLHDSQLCFLQFPQKAPPGWVPPARLLTQFNANRARAKEGQTSGATAAVVAAAAGDELPTWPQSYAPECNPAVIEPYVRGCVEDEDFGTPWLA